MNRYDPGAEPDVRARRRRWVPIRVGAILLLLLALGFIPRWWRTHQLAKASAQRRTAAIPVQATRAHWGKDPGVMLPGSMVSIEEATVNARANGYVAKYYVDLGAEVKSGQRLAEVQAPDIDAEYGQSVAQTAQAKATLQQAEVNVPGLRAAVLQAAAQRDADATAVTSARDTAQSYHDKLLEADHTMRGDLATLKLDKYQLLLAQRTYARYKLLGGQGYVTQQQVDTTMATYGSANAKVESDEDTVKIAQATIEDARNAWHSYETSVSTAQSTLRAAEHAVRVAQAALDVGLRTVQMQMAALEAAAENERHFGALRGFETVVAPFDGLVTARNVDVGTLVSGNSTSPSDTDPANTAPKTGMFTIARLNPMWINVQVPQTYVTGIHVGQPTDVYVRELPGEKFVGSLSMIAGALDEPSRTVQVKVTVTNPAGRLRPGMYADINFGALKLIRTLRVPTTAVLFDAKGTRVDVIRPNSTIHRQTVSVGRDFGDETEILSGLAINQRVVVSPSDDLHEGTRVEVVERKSAYGDANKNS